MAFTNIDLNRSRSVQTFGSQAGAKVFDLLKSLNESAGSTANSYDLTEDLIINSPSIAEFSNISVMVSVNGGDGGVVRLDASNKVGVVPDISGQNSEATVGANAGLLTALVNIENFSGSHVIISITGFTSGQLLDLVLVAK